LAETPADATGDDVCYRLSMVVKRHLWQHFSKEVLSKTHLFRLFINTQMQRCFALQVLDEGHIKVIFFGGDFMHEFDDFKVLYTFV
jgi:hypothetical protein